MQDDLEEINSSRGKGENTSKDSYNQVNKLGCCETDYKTGGWWKRHNH